MRIQSKIMRTWLLAALIGIAGAAIQMSPAEAARMGGFRGGGGHWHGGGGNWRGGHAWRGGRGWNGGWHGRGWYGYRGWGGPRWGWGGWWGPGINIYVGGYGRRCWSPAYGYYPCRYRYGWGY